jgi:pyruvate/2-oxoglutarate dehydrogenase complex dihydrolipoamide acyltransferase (E2) component
MTVELQNPPAASQASAAATAKLVIPRDRAITQIRAQLEKGLEIKRTKIRYVSDLERAREAKGEWTTTVMTLLKGMFSNGAVADECQNWVGKVLPEYADLNLFIEHFYDEMDQRLRKLHHVLRRVQDLPDDNMKPTITAVSTKPAPVTAPPPASSPDFFDAPAKVHAPAPAAAAPATASRGAPATTPSMRPKTGAFVVYEDDARAQAAVRDFCTKLGFEIAEINGSGGDASKNTLVEQLDQRPNLDFGLILSRADAPPKPFELGYCVGRLGLKRVFVLSASDDRLTADEHGLLHIPLDPADGWQLHLARQLKRAGLEIDLNRVF